MPHKCIQVSEQGLLGSTYTKTGKGDYYSSYYCSPLYQLSSWLIFSLGKSIIVVISESPTTVTLFSCQCNHQSKFLLLWMHRQFKPRSLFLSFSLYIYIYMWLSLSVWWSLFWWHSFIGSIVFLPQQFSDRWTHPWMKSKPHNSLRYFSISYLYGPSLSVL